ncbi:hypothetical protein MNBD_ALPHA07-629 [hydrothermal vent metagenome]|uniref:Uncharacterized protein n=1 Tax=hydrothermal vent metagenome TaxID=652676 RepID=A0A3B0RZT3_9ZZZZ
MFRGPVGQAVKRLLAMAITRVPEILSPMATLRMREFLIRTNALELPGFMSVPIRVSRARGRACLSVAMARVSLGVSVACAIFDWPVLHCPTPGIFYAGGRQRPGHISRFWQ